MCPPIAVDRSTIRPKATESKSKECRRMSAYENARDVANALTAPDVSFPFRYCALDERSDRDDQQRWGLVPNVAACARYLSGAVPEQVSVDAAIAPHSNLKISQIVSLPVVF
jgi:hypothetical protein